MASALRLYTLNLRKIQPFLTVRQISTSKKNQETVTVTDTVKEPVTVPAVNKNWVNYGFHYKNEATDKSYLNLTFFSSVTIGLVLSGFAWMYAPDINLKDWAQREAFIELKCREAAGLPLIDANLISPKKIVLPSDEELGNEEIII